MPTAQAGSHDVWIFGYGSLMWRPDFPFAERAAATVSGYHRAFCIASTLHRGTPRRPGLVLGLDRGGVCAGVAYRVAAANVPGVLHYLRERELIYGVYCETQVPIAIAMEGPDRMETALAYTVERRHPSYQGRLPLPVQAAVIRGARGQSGANLDYLINTVRHLGELGIRERGLERLMSIAAGHTANMRDDVMHRPGVAGLRAVWARARVPNLVVPRGDQRRFGHRLRMTGR